MDTYKKILKNAVRCNICGDIIESQSVHDFKTCSCGAVSVDGGLNHLSRTYKSRDVFTELSVTVDEELPPIKDKEGL